MSYPFRFYGRVAGFDEEYILPATLSVRFSRVPEESEREQLGVLWQRCLRRALDHWGSAAHWSGPVLVLDAVGRYFGSEGAVLRALTDMLLRAHSVVPIDDAVNHSSFEVGRWESWSLAQGRPSAGPAGLPEAARAELARPVDPALPPPAKDEVFERAARQEAVARDREALLASAKLPAARKLGLEATDDVVASRPVELSAWESLDDVPGTRITGTRIPCCWVREGGRRRVASLVDGQWKTVPLLVSTPALATLAGSGQSPAVDAHRDLVEGQAQVSADGRFLLVFDRYVAYEIDLARATAREWYASANTSISIAGVAYLADERRAILVTGELLVFDVKESADSAEVSLRSSAKVAQASCHLLKTARGGSVLVASAHEGSPVFFAYVAGEVKRLGALKGKTRWAGESQEGEVLLFDATGQRQRVTGISESMAELERKAAAKKKKAGKKKQSSSKRQFVLESLQWGSWSALPPVPDALKQAVQSGPRRDGVINQVPMVAFPSGLAVAFGGNPTAASYWCPRQKRVVDLMPALRDRGLSPRRYATDAEGRSIYLLAGTQIYHVDVETGELQHIVLPSLATDLGVAKGLVVTGAGSIGIAFDRGVGIALRGAGGFVLQELRKVPKTQALRRWSNDAEGMVVLSQGKNRVVVVDVDVVKGQVVELAKFQEHVDGMGFDVSGYCYVYNRQLRQAWKVVEVSR